MTKKRRVRVYKKGKKSYQAGGQPQQADAQMQQEQQQQLVFAVMQELSSNKTPEEVIKLLQKQYQLEEQQAIQIVKTAMDVLIQQKQSAEFQGHEQEQQMLDQLNDPQGMSRQPMAQNGYNVREIAPAYSELDDLYNQYSNYEGDEVGAWRSGVNNPMAVGTTNQDAWDRYLASRPKTTPYVTPEYDTMREMPNFGIRDKFQNWRQNRQNRRYRKHAVPSFRAHGGNISMAKRFPGLDIARKGYNIPMYQKPPGQIWNDTTVGPLKDNWRDWPNLYPNVSSELIEGFNLLNLSPEGIKKLTGMSLDELFKPENIELLRKNNWKLGENYPPKQQAGGSLPKHQNIGPVKNLFKPTPGLKNIYNNPIPNINPVRNFYRNFNPVRNINTLHPNINPLWFAFGDRAPGPMLLKSMNKLYPFGTNLSGFNPENLNIDPNLLHSTFTNIEDVYKYQGLDTRGSHSSRFLENINSNQPIGSPVPYPNIFDTKGMGYWSRSGMPQDNVRVFGATYPNLPFNMKGIGTGISLHDPDLNLYRRLPFSEKYIPIDKQKMLNDEFQWATSLGNAQSLLEKYGITATAATILGLLGGDTDGNLREEYNKITIDPLIDFGNQAWDFLKGLPEKQEGGSLPRYQGTNKSEVNMFGNTPEEQASINAQIKSKQVAFPTEYYNLRNAYDDKRNWEAENINAYFSGAAYPYQAQLDSLKTVYDNLVIPQKQEGGPPEESDKPQSIYDVKKNKFIDIINKNVDLNEIDEEYKSLIEEADMLEAMPYPMAKKGGQQWMQRASESMKKRGTVGSFTKYCGGKVTLDCIRKGLNSKSKSIRKKAAFAKASWKVAGKMQMGGNLPMHQIPPGQVFNGIYQIQHPVGMDSEYIHNPDYINLDINNINLPSEANTIVKQNEKKQKPNVTWYHRQPFILPDERDGGQPCFECGGSVYEDGGELAYYNLGGGWWDGWKKKRQENKDFRQSYKEFKNSNPYGWRYKNLEKNIYNTDINPETGEKYTQSRYDLTIDPSSKFTRKDADIKYTKEYFNPVEQMPDFKTKTVSGVNKKGIPYTRQVSALEEGDVGYGTGEYKSPDLTSEFDPWEYYDMNDPRLDPTSDQYDPNFSPMIKTDKETYEGEMTLEGDPRNKSKFGMFARSVGENLKDKFIKDPVRGLGMIASFTDDDDARNRMIHAGSTMGQLPDHQYRQALVNRTMEEPFTRGQTDPNNLREFITHIGQGTHSLGNAPVYAQLGAQVGDEVEMTEEELRKFISMGGEVEILNY